MFDDQMMCTHRRFDVNAATPLYDIFIVNYLVLNSNLFIVYTSYIESFLQIHCFDIYFNIFFICIIIHPCGSSKYKYKQTKHRKLQFDHNIGYTK